LILQEVDEAQVHEAVEAVVHTILFNRALGEVEFEEKRLQKFPSLSYIRCDADQVRAAVDDALDNLDDRLELVGPDLVRGHVEVSFFEVRQRKGFLGLGGPTEARVYWERWRLPVVVHKGSLQAVAAEEGLRNIILSILQQANSVAIVPRIKSDSSKYPVFPFEVSVSPISDGAPKEGFFNQLLAKGPPVSMRFNIS